MSGKILSSVQEKSNVSQGISLCHHSALRLSLEIRCGCLNILTLGEKKTNSAMPKVAGGSPAEGAADSSRPSEITGRRLLFLRRAVVISRPLGALSHLMGAPAR